MELQKGRPQEIEGRLPKEIRTYDFLDKLGVEYYRVDHEAAMTMEDCEAIDKVLLASTCKNLFLCNRQETDFYLLLMPANKPFRTKELSTQLGVARLSFASAEYMERFLDITPGAVSVMGLINDKDKNVRLLIDKDLLSEEDFGCHPCVNTTSIKIKTAELFEKILPELGREHTVVEL
jgi:Ala-tRNA(Pro) deacylase